MRGKDTLEVWVIYQGKVSESFIDDQLSKKFNEFQEEAPIIFHITRNKSKSAEGNIYTRINEDLARCKAALALVTSDNRKASEAGNLWLEIGMWLVSKDPDDLLICVNEEVSELISDLKGKAIHRWSKLDDLWVEIIKHVYRIKEKYFPNSNDTSSETSKARKKINDTFDPGDDRWFGSEMYKCPLQREHCGFRENSFEFTAELLRMGRSNWERSSIICTLLQIAECANNIVSTTSVGQHDTELTKKFDNLHNKINIFFEESKKLLVRNNNYKKEWDICQRLEGYIKHRLKCAHELCDSGHLPLPFRPILLKTWISTIDKFIKWANDFNQKGIGLDILEQTLLHNNGNRNKFLADLIIWGDYCAKVAQVLELLGKNYFESCRAQLKTHLQSIDNKHKMHEVLKKAVESLPHNDPENGHSSIWPKSNLR
jgi:hypothetical protein